MAYSHDSWTTQQMKYSFTGTIATWINRDWEYVERVIDFAYVEEDGHQALGSAIAFINSAAKRGGLNKMSLNSPRRQHFNSLANYSLHVCADDG